MHRAADVGERKRVCSDCAARGTVDRALLERLLDEAWFALPPPKSTGREQFHLDWVDARLQGHVPPEDVQATLLELTAVTVCQALRREQPDTRRVLVCGGGVRNAGLLQRIAANLPGLWASTAMGARGLTLALLCGELLAARLQGEPLPIDARLAKALGTERLP